MIEAAFPVMVPQSSVQFSSVTQSCPTLCDPMNRSMPGLPVHHQLRSSLRLTSIKSVMPYSHLILSRSLLLLPPIPPSIRVFSNESTLHTRWAKYWSSLKLTSIESVMPSSHLILGRPLLLLPPIPPSIRVFSNESTLHMRWPKYWSFSFSISPSKEHPRLISFRID